MARVVGAGRCATTRWSLFAAYRRLLSLAVAGRRWSSLVVAGRGMPSLCHRLSVTILRALRGVLTSLFTLGSFWDRMRH
jgi:hypothetical protein